MKVVHIFKTYFPDTQGGLEESIRQISGFTTSKGVKNKIITVSPNPEPKKVKFTEAEVIRYKTSLDVLSTPLSISFFNNCQQELDDCDILHFHFPWPFAEMVYLLQKKNKPAIVTYHADVLRFKPIKFFFKPVINKFLSQVDKIVATSQSFLDSSQDLQLYRDKCSVIHLSIGMDRFKQNAKNEDQGRIIAEVEAQYGTNFFLFVGVLRDYKGLEYLIRAMEGVKEKLVIIGKGKNKAKLETLASSLGLKNVFFPGYLGDQYLQAFFKLSRAFVLPSIERSEAFGVSLLEASLFSKPMISTELFTGTSFVNKHLETGLVVPPKDISALRKALMKLSSDDQLCKIYGENAQKRYERNFVPEITGKQYLELYDELLISK